MTTLLIFNGYIIYYLLTNTQEGMCGMFEEYHVVFLETWKDNNVCPIYVITYTHPHTLI